MSTSLAAPDVPVRGQSNTGGKKLEEALVVFREDGNLARTIVVWKHDKGSARERLPLIRGCARLGQTELVLALLVHNLDTLLHEEVVLDAIRSDRATVSAYARTRASGTHNIAWCLCASVVALSRLHALVSLEDLANVACPVILVAHVGSMVVVVRIVKACCLPWKKAIVG